MTIANAISSTLTGLSVRAREAGTVSSNIANSTTEGYARRVLDVSAGPYGTVRVEGVRRVEDTVLSADLRIASASAAGSETTADALRRLERAFGAPDEPGSLTAKLARVEAALVDAASDPGSEARLRAVSNALVQFTAGVQAASDAIRDARTAAEANIEKDVTGLEQGLRRVAVLNAQIAKARAVGRDVAALEDERRAEIDQLSQSVPVKVYERRDGMVSLVARGGVQLLEGVSPAAIAFDAAGLVTADMTVASGGLQGVEVRGEPTDATVPGGRLSGGTLGANFTLRDDTLTTLQTRLDAFAQDVATKLQSTTLDATLAGPPAEPGLLTDAQDRVGAAPAPGLAGRLEVNGSLGAQLWRLRDGLGATATQGAVGDSTLLRGLAEAFAKPTAAPPSFAPGSRNASELLADVVSGVSSARLAAEDGKVMHAASAEVLRQEERADGVDTDVELQNLMRIERGYAAGARVLMAVDDMLARILEI